MTIEAFIYVAAAIIPILSLLYLPKHQIRKALISYLTFQTTTWFVSNMLVQTGNIIYPVREFVKATRVNFIPQFLLYPAIFMWFVLLFPKDKGRLYKLMHFLNFLSIMVWFAFFAHKFTGINRYKSTNYLSIILNSYVRMSLQYIFSYLIVKWFLKDERLT